ncbi:MAG: helix-turn-helix domain-containing protein [Henriciella sp.]|nr:helix-turn-helix domain-containing protein [Henriciella sp.]
MQKQYTNPPHKMTSVIARQHAGNVDAWIEACGANFGNAPLSRDDALKEYRAKSWFVDPISVNHTHYYSMATQRRNWHIEETGGQIHVHRYAKGRSSLLSDGVPLECSKGAVTLLDYGRPFSSLHSDNECHSFFVPYDAIGYHPSDAPHALVYSAQTRMGQLLGYEMDNLLSQLSRGATHICPDDVERFVSCVEVAMSPKTASPSACQRVRDCLKRRIQDFIEQRLKSPDLSTTTILKNFGVSRASLYRLFDEEHGVRTYINHRRLVRAVTDLAETPMQWGQIHRVSERWGFTSDASFSRMVKREFGVAPGSLFEMPVRFGNHESPSSDVQAMMMRRARTPILELKSAKMAAVC